MEILLGADARPVANLIRGVQDDFFTIRETAKDLRFTLIALTDLNLATFRAPALDRKHAPALSLAKKSALGNLQDLLTRPDYGSRLHSVAVPKRPGRIDKIRNDVDALLFDSKGGNLREAPWLDKPDACPNWVISSPSFQQNRHARLNFHGVCGKDIGNNFQLFGITKR